MARDGKYTRQGSCTKGHLPCIMHGPNPSIGCTWSDRPSKDLFPDLLDGPALVLCLALS